MRYTGGLALVVRLNSFNSLIFYSNASYNQRNI